MAFTNIGFRMVKENLFKIIQMVKKMENVRGGMMMVHYKMN
jgi:hypothetical protein